VPRAPLTPAFGGLFAGLLDRANQWSYEKGPDNYGTSLVEDDAGKSVRIVGDILTVDGEVREADWSGIAHSNCHGVLKTVGPQYMGTVTVQDPDDADVIVCTFLNPYADNLILLSFDEVEVNAKKLQSTGDKVQMVEDFRKITDASGLNIYMYGWLFIQIEQFIFLQSHFYFAAAIAMLIVWACSLMFGLSWLSALINATFAIIMLSPNHCTMPSFPKHLHGSYSAAAFGTAWLSQRQRTSARNIFLNCCFPLLFTQCLPAFKYGKVSSPGRNVLGK